MDGVLQSAEIQDLLRRYPRAAVREAVREELADLRDGVLEGRIDAAHLPPRLSRLSGMVELRLAGRFAASLRPVVNATGIVIHTNAGRAPLAASVAEEVARVASGYSNLEYDLESGGRGHRDRHFEARMRRLTGCEAATVCNNNAAAVLLILNTLALGKNVLVSRGELVEIGGSFRIPDIMERGGARLREVGTTNKTRISDYRAALDAETGLMLKVHPSNYRIVGFTHSPSLDELAALSRETGVPVVHDVGSGQLRPSDLACLAREPDVAESLRAGVDLVCFSGDKLLGGPQAGIVVGKKAWIERLRRNPLMRALRLDKLAYAALERTLLEYELERQDQTVPVRRMLAETVEQMLPRARALGRKLAELGYQVEVVEGRSLAGGGSAPEEGIETRLVAIRLKGVTAGELERSMRAHDPPILARIEDDRLLMDLRTVPEGDEDIIAHALARAANGASPDGAGPADR